MVARLPVRKRGKWRLHLHIGKNGQQKDGYEPTNPSSACAQWSDTSGIRSTYPELLECWAAFARLRQAPVALSVTGSCLGDEVLGPVPVFVDHRSCGSPDLSEILFNVVHCRAGCDCVALAVPTHA